MRAQAVAASVFVCAAALGAQADCTKLDGIYRFRSVESGNDAGGSLGNLAGGAARSKLYKTEAVPGPTGLTSSQPIARPKVTDIAVAARLAYAPGAVQWHFMDAAGHPLATLPLDSSHPWTCSGDRLTRSFQRIGGLGDNIRTDRIEEVLERSAAGELVHRETITTIEGGKGTKVREAHFPAAKAAAPH
jgi:hypothetical protein